MRVALFETVDMASHPSAPFLFPMEPRAVQRVLQAAFDEDWSGIGDVTASTVVPDNAVLRAKFTAREPIVVAGTAVAIEALQYPQSHETRVEARVHVADGTRAPSGSTLLSVCGPARTILARERVALNLMARMCSIATYTQRLVDLVTTAAKSEGIRSVPTVCHTRKTTPGLRALELYAVQCGGGGLHRRGLFDAALIKDNHLAAGVSISDAVARARAGNGHMRRVSVEVDTWDQFLEAATTQTDVILLDNFPPERCKEAVLYLRGDPSQRQPLTIALEVSGGITEKNIAAYATTGVDYLSSGRITHNPPPVDLALDVDVDADAGADADG